MIDASQVGTYVSLTLAHFLTPSSGSKGIGGRQTHESPCVPRPGPHSPGPYYGPFSSQAGPDRDLRAGQTAMQAAPWEIGVGLSARVWPRPYGNLGPQLAVNFIQVRPPPLRLHLAG